MEFVLLPAAVLLLAFANGANDNFKGVATLHGSHRATFRTAIAWATVTTFAGSLTALWLGSRLVETFSGKGLVPAALVGDPGFVLAVAIGAGATVLCATRLGFPISTTHALLGALVGGGLVAANGDVRIGFLGKAALLPLVLSPLVAMLATAILYRAFRRARLRLGINEESCVCFSAAEPAPAPAPDPQGVRRSELGTADAVPELRVHKAGCKARLGGTVIGMNAQTALDSAHFLSAGAVGFARGLNDTPKIVALLAVGMLLGLPSATFLVGLAIAVGGLLAAHRVARTLSHEITPMNAGQGFTGNLVTAVLVLFASRLGFPVSTTHISVGALFGIGAVTGGARKHMITSILLSWLITLPLAAAIAAAAALLTT